MGAEEVLSPHFAFWPKLLVWSIDDFHRHFAGESDKMELGSFQVYGWLH